MKPSDVTVQQCLDAYAETGLTPVSTTTYNTTCGCLLGALVLQQEKKLDVPCLSTNQALKMLFENGNDRGGWELAAGFDYGFDNRKIHGDEGAIFNVGYEVGRTLSPLRHKKST